MTEREINVAIAEACGWQKCSTAGACWISPDGYHCNEDNGRKLPNYCTDLNAIAEAEKVLSEPQREEYFYELFGVLGIDPTEPADPQLIFVALTAFARQRAEAFLRTIGKWRS